MNRHRVLLSLLAVLGSLAVPAVAAAASGDLDSSFGSGGVRSLATGTQLYGVAVQSNRGVVAVGSSGTSFLGERFSASGAAQGSFGSGPGVGRAVVVQPDGKFVVAGSDGAGMLVERFNAGGGLDGSFGSHGVVHAVPGGSANAVGIGPGGTIVAAGQVPGVDGFARIALLRLTSSGRPDTGLGAGGVHVVDLGQDSIARGVAVQGDGKIVLGGSIGPGAHQITSGFVARVSSTGTLDSTFGSHGVYVLAPQPGGGELTLNALALDPSGGIVAGGGATTVNQSVAVVARLSCSGAPDHSFAGSGVQVSASSRNFATQDYGANGVAVVAGRNVVAAGRYQDSGLASAALWGYQSNGALAFVKTAPPAAQANALAVDSAGDLVVAGSNIPAGFAPSGFVARYAAFGGRASGTSPCGGVVSSKPVLSGVGQAHRVWAEKKSKRHNVPVGTKFSFTLNQAASVKFTFTQRVGGRKVNRRCVAQTSRNRHKPSCKRTLTRGTITVNRGAGKSSLSFNGRIPRHGKLRPGTYTVSITATSSGQRSSAKSLTFKIVG